MHLHFINAQLCDNGEITYGGDLWVNLDSGKIVNKPAAGTPYQTVDLKGAILAPGFVDVQVNGLYGLNFSDLKLADPESVKSYKNFYKDAMTKYLSTGVTSICPTLPSNFPEAYEHSVPLLGPSRTAHQVDSLGAHLEGPFINLKKPGCHPTETFVDAQDGGAKKFYQIYGGQENILKNVCIITAAPEIEGVLDSIPELKSNNVVYSIGHTTADYKTGLKAIEKGATMITHLYNAMPQPHHRDVGVVGLVSSPIPKELGKETPYFGLIADGVHVDPSMCALAFKAAPEKCMLVTDAMHLIGLPDGIYQWDDQKIVKTGPILKIQGTDTLAGAATDLDACIRNIVEWAGVPLAKAIQAATNNPALAIGVQDRKGFLNVGCDADLVVLSGDAQLKQVYKLGRKVADREHAALLAQL